MSLTNTASSYGSVTKTFHWLIALMIIGVIATGATASNLSTSDPVSLDWKISLYSIHKTLGLAIFFTALARIAWAISQPKPGPIGDNGKAQHFMAELCHWTLYASLVLVPLTGWMTHAATEGFAPIKWPFGQELPFIPNDPELAERLATLHMFFERVLLISILLHVAGGLKHHLWDKDATLRRMWFGSPTLPEALPAKHAALPAVTAAIIFAAVGTAAALQPVGRGTDLAILEEVASDWRVLEGSIDITVNQFGTDVTGSFSEWTANISFDPDTSDPIKGSAEVTVAIGSLTLGSVTGEALATDFLDAATFPTASVVGDIVEAGEGYVLDGTITIKGAEVPLVLPFDLSLEGEVAQATGTTALQRLDFNVGQSMPGGDTVGLGVDVTIRLTATTAPEAPTS